VKPQNALAHKGAAVEEWIDLHFFRPVGMRIARALGPTDVSADEVTLWSLALGLVAGHLFLYHERWVNAIGVGLFIVSDILDSADGQLARLRGTSTRTGRILDGVSDNLRFVNLYAHLLVRIWLMGYGWPGALLVAFAGLSHSFQSAAADFVRNAFLYAGTGGGELDLPEDMDEPARGSWIERLTAWAYRGYVRRQALLFPRTVTLFRRLRAAGTPEAFRLAYADRQQPLLPLCTWLGQNIRFALLAVVAFTGRPGLLFWTEASAMNVVLVTLLVLHEWNAAGLAESLSGAEKA